MTENPVADLTKKFLSAVPDESSTAVLLGALITTLMQAHLLWPEFRAAVEETGDQDLIDSLNSCEETFAGNLELVARNLRRDEVN